MHMFADLCIGRMCGTTWNEWMYNCFATKYLIAFTESVVAPLSCCWSLSRHFFFCVPVQWHTKIIACDYYCVFFFSSRGTKRIIVFVIFFYEGNRILTGDECLCVCVDILCGYNVVVVGFHNESQSKHCRYFGFVPSVSQENLRSEMRATVIHLSLLAEVGFACSFS